MKLTLYYAPVACSLVPYVTLSEAGAEFEVHPINMQRGEHNNPDFLRLNPRHRVPVLIIDGEPLVENVAIQVWIARQFPQARLLPSEPMSYVQAISLLAWCASGIHPTLTPNALPHRYCDLPGSEDSVRACAQKLLRENLQVAEQRLTQREWFFDHFTAVDAYFFWCFRRATLFKIELDEFKSCMAHFQRMQQRASVQKLLAYEKQVQAAFAAAS